MLKNEMDIKKRFREACRLLNECSNKLEKAHRDSPVGVTGTKKLINKIDDFLKGEK